MLSVQCFFKNLYSQHHKHWADLQPLRRSLRFRFLSCWGRMSPVWVFKVICSSILIRNLNTVQVTCALICIFAVPKPKGSLSVIWHTEYFMVYLLQQRTLIKWVLTTVHLFYWSIVMEVTWPVFTLPINQTLCLIWADLVKSSHSYFHVWVKVIILFYYII